MNTPPRPVVTASAERVILHEATGNGADMPTSPEHDTIVIPHCATEMSASPTIPPTRVGMGSLLFVPARTCTGIGLGAGHSAALLQICPSVRRSLNQRLGGEHGQVPVAAQLVQGQPQVSAILAMIRLLPAWEQDQPRDELHLLAELLLRNLARTGAPPPAAAPPAPQTRLSPRHLERIDRYIEDNLEAGFRLQHLAELVGMSRYHFLRCFKRATGISPLQYVLARRVDRAQVLLARGQDSIAEIAYATGFSSQSHLNAMFKRHFGVTPGAFRRRAVAGAVAAPPCGEQPCPPAHARQPVDPQFLARPIPSLGFKSPHPGLSGA